MLLLLFFLIKRMFYGQLSLGKILLYDPIKKENYTTTENIVWLSSINILKTFAISLNFLISQDYNFYLQRDTSEGYVSTE